MATAAPIRAIFAFTLLLAVAAGECCPCPGPGGGGCACDAATAASLLAPSSLLPESAPSSARSGAEEGKNLLEPEVNLAAGVLDTLQRATDAEYREALARDAARLADMDAAPEESASVLVLLEPPGPAPLEQAPHVLGARCVPPARAARPGYSRVSPASFTRARFPQALDSDVGASQVTEIVTDAVGGPHSVLGLRLRSSPNILKSLLDAKNDNVESDTLPKENDWNHSTEDIALFRKPESRPWSAEAPAKLDHHRQLHLDHDKLPWNLRNILKLRDVELIPKSIRNKASFNPKVDTSQFAIPTILSKNKNVWNDNCDLQEKASNLNAFRVENDDRSMNKKEMETGASELILDNGQEVEKNAQDNDTEATESSSSDSDMNDFMDKQSRDLSEKTADVRNNERATNLNENETFKNQFSHIPEDLDGPKEACPDSSRTSDKTSSKDSGTDASDTFTTLELLKKLEIADRHENDAIESKFLQNGEKETLHEDKTITSPSFSEEINSLPTVGDTLTLFRKNVVKQLDNKDPVLKTNFVKSQDFKRTDSDDDGRENSAVELISNNNKPITFFDDLSQDVSSKIDSYTPGTDMSINDLQNMSNSLLNSNLENQKEVTYDHDNNNSEISKYKLNSNGMENNERTRSKTIQSNECDIVADKMSHKNEAETSNEVRDSNVKEMETGSSDTILSTLPALSDPLKLRSPFLDNIIRRPTDPVDSLRKPLENILNLNSNLPALDDITEQLTGFFKASQDSSEAYSSSLSAESAEAAEETPAVAASVRNPLVARMHDAGHDMRSMRPTSSPPRDAVLDRLLPFDSYRAHLPSPTTLQLKPLTIKQKDKDMDRPKLNLRPIGSSIDSLNGVGTLEELRNSMQSNTKDVLSKLIHPELNQFSGKLHSPDIQDAAENMRLNTEKTLKGIRRKMKSALKRTKLRNSPSDSFATPQDLLEDMNDKLEGIRHDLDDRLAAFRATLLDAGRSVSKLDQPRKATNRNVMTEMRKRRPQAPRVAAAASAPAGAVREPPLSRTADYRDTDWNRVRATQAQAAPTTNIASPKPQTHRSLSDSYRASSLQRQPAPAPIVPAPRERLSLLRRDQPDDRDTKRPALKAGMRSAARRQPTVEISFATPAPPLTSMRDSAPAPSAVDEDYEDTLDNFWKEESRGSSDKLSPPRPVLRESPDAKVPSSPDKLSDKFGPRKDLLLREPLVASGAGKQASTKLPHPAGNLRKPSDTHPVADPVLKENVSYTCKMICTKQIR